MNFEICEDKSVSINRDKTNFSTSSVGTCLRLMPSVEDNMPVNRDSSSQEAGNYFSSVLIKCEEPEMSDSDTYNTEMDSKHQILNTVNTNEQSGLVVNIKPEPFEFESRVKQEFVSNQEAGPIDDPIKYEKTEMSCPDPMFFSEEAMNTNEKFNFNASNASTTVKCDLLATETYVKQENEVYVVPLFSTFSNDNNDTDHNNGDDRSVLVNEKQSQLKCDVCNKTFTRRRGLKNHKRTHTGEKPYQCDVCSKNFTHSWYLNKHKRIHTGEKPYKCDTCDKCFIKHELLQVHQRLHSGEKPYRCDICDKTFSQIIYLNFHKNAHTGEKPYRCDICDKCFPRRDSFRVHRRSHFAEKPYSCDICKKGFSRSSLLITHKSIHASEKPYRCDVCRDCFPTLSSLIIHTRIHTDERPYKCDVCDASFSQSLSLNTHKLTHTGEKPYQCDVCNAFYQLSHLRGHKRTRTDEGSFRCYVCDETRFF